MTTHPFDFITDIPAGVLRQLLKYEPDTGKMYWRTRDASIYPYLKTATSKRLASWNKQYAGSEAFKSSDDSGYLTGQIFGKSYRAHRVVWAIQTGEWPVGQVDHINGNVSDNSWGNLRIATHSENMANRSTSRGKKSSPFLGVYVDKAGGQARQFRAATGKDGVVHKGPRRACHFRAARDYDALAKKHHGEFARLNFQNRGTA